MPQAVLLFNGIYYSFTAESRAFSWAQKTGGSIEAIFLKAKNEEDEGYGFPSDLDAAENLYTDKDAENEDEQIIRNHMNMIERDAASEQITLNTSLLIDIPMSELIAKCSGADMVFIPRKLGRKDLLCIDIDIAQFTKNLKEPFEIVEEN
jgi:hypothetical protein